MNELPPTSLPSTGWRWPEAAGGRPFFKMHGLRNHFVIVDGRTDFYAPSPAEVTRICDPEVGVGAEQVIVVEAPTSAIAAASMRILNVDGRESEACGNASRCVAWLLMAESGAREVAIESRGGLLRCRATAPDRVEIDMGQPRLDWREIPLSQAVDTAHLGLEHGPLSDPAAVSMGNPHVTFFVDDLDAVDIARWAPAIQRHALFPEQVNVGVAQVMGRDSIRLAVWERPGILTAACGTGACVAAVSAVRRGYSDARRFAVIMRGGTVTVTLTDAGSVLMEGEVAVSFVGRLP